MTLSINAQNAAPNAQQLNVLVHHDEYDKPETGATLRVGPYQVHLTGEETIKLGTFLVGGHTAVDQLDV